MTEDLRKLLGEATPGEWSADGPVWNQIIWTDSETRLCFMAHSSGLNDGRDIANARLIAMAPMLGRKVIDLSEAMDRDAETSAARIAALEAESASLRERVAGLENEQEKLKEALTCIKNAWSVHGYDNAVNAVCAMKDIALEALND
ncbi:hypothetical protein [Gemmobacter sp. 24YEA27]|uniref:hypothetical protein n=1 Tax=Gemmobacter sp. 24YEA27 TaxID=3040672 RepID=UPI0024B36B9D|nr:hypothetical protein [Gemmobacter sp. 24YEA27]